MQHLLDTVRPFIPKKVFRRAQPIYHYTLALLSALIYRFPSRHLVIIGVTGTKGKSSTCEYVNAILEKAGYQTALASTIRHKIGGHSQPNKFKMTVPGRFFVQHFLRKAVVAGCSHVVLELSSEAVLQYRHRFVDLNALIVTNISPEHIESHGSYENYINAKLAIARRVVKKDGLLIVNADDQNAERFLALPIPHKTTYTLNAVKPFETKQNGVVFTLGGNAINTHIKGLFTIYNMLGAITYAQHIGISDTTIREALEEITEIQGRGQEIHTGKNFIVVVDYAHTTDSLKAIYEAYDGYTIIGVLGGTGGGRDTWKRKEMGAIADTYCRKIFITNEDPYDEDPWNIINHVADGVSHVDKVKKILDRRKAIREALVTAEHLQKSHNKVAVLITGKGTDPYIMEANNKKTPWSDAEVVREELARL